MANKSTHTEINKNILSLLQTIMAVSTVPHGSDNITSVIHFGRRTEREEMKFLKCGARICV